MNQIKKGCSNYMLQKKRLETALPGDVGQCSTVGCSKDLLGVKLKDGVSPGPYDFNNFG